ncbi:MAG: hypothetical protein AAF721_21915 [Myxococcota bacterium]
MTILRISLGLLVIVAGACAGDDSNADTSNVAMTFSTAPGDGGDGGDDDGDGGTATGGPDDGQDDGQDDAPPTSSDTTAGPDTNPPDDSGDDATDSGPPPTPACQHQCATPQDCMIDGMESGLGCNAGVCSIACADDATCIAAASGWTLIPCDTTAECAEGGGVCVDTGGGVGGCSLQPSQGACSEAGLVEMMATTIEGSMVTVCGQPNAICTMLGAQNVCIVDCIGNACGGELSCEADGLCHCDFDTQCVDAGMGNNCNGSGLCEWACQMPADCPPHPFDGGQATCV